MNPTNDSNSTAGNAPAFTPGAMRAARALWPNGVASCYMFDTEAENEAAKLRDWEAKARVIDRETAAPELLEALRKIADASSYPAADHESVKYAYSHVRQLARAAIAKATGQP